MGHDQGATPESINTLPTYKFKSKRQHTRGEGRSNSDSQGHGGRFAPGIDKERTLSAEDAVSCLSTKTCRVVASKIVYFSSYGLKTLKVFLMFCNFVGLLHMPG